LAPYGSSRHENGPSGIAEAVLHDTSGAG